METKALSKAARRLIVETCYKAGEGHIGSALGVIDILIVLYAEILKSYENNEDPGRDIFILSKGHASLAQLASLAVLGHIPERDLSTYCAVGSKYGGHLSSLKADFAETSTGSLGQGLAVGCGIAHAKNVRNIEGHVYVMIGDGEANEGSIWESLLIINKFKIQNITILYDDNCSTERAIPMDNMRTKFEAFGLNTFDCDGHNHEELCAVISAAKQTGRSVIIMKTTKGFGSRITEDNPEWHHKVPNDLELKKILQDFEL